MKRCNFTPLYLLPFVALILACSVTQKIKTGEQAYEYKRYHQAAQLLTEEFETVNQQRDKARKAFLLGRSYEYMNEAETSAKWYFKAFQLNYGEEALRSYADQLRKSEQYDEAIEIYNQLQAAGQGNQYYRRMITVCQQAMEWNENKDRNPYFVSPAQINTPASDYAPYVFAPGKLIISSDMPQSTGDDNYHWTGRFFSDLYLVDMVENTVERFDPEINTKHNEGTACVSEDGETLFFVRCSSGNEYDSYCKIMQSRKNAQGWSKPEVAGFCKPGINYGSPFLAPGDSVLFFSADDPEGKGGYDLYWIKRINDQWGVPVLLPERINTSGHEKFPAFHNDTLYFSSDTHVGMGGLDIFRTYLMSDGTWSPPQNMKAPVNSGADDFYFMVDPYAEPKGKILQKGYFSSSRAGGAGSDDIYVFEKVRIEPEVVTEAETEVEEPSINYQIFLAIRVMEPVYEVPGDPNSKRVNFKPLPVTSIQIAEGEKEKLLRTDDNGFLVIQLEFEKGYSIKAGYPGHLSQRKDFSTKNLPRDPDQPVQTHNMNMILDPIFKGKEIVLENIYYDFDEWFIREDAKPTLDSLAGMLFANPKIRIQLSSHTDCRGNTEYNQELSQKRAESAVIYLIEKGIDAGRLVAKGYGESQLLINCRCEICSEEQHQQNRRTTFKIID